MNAILREDEVPVSSTEVLEANVAAIRVDLNELKTDFRAAVARIDGDIKSAEDLAIVAGDSCLDRVTPRWAARRRRSLLSA